MKPKKNMEERFNGLEVKSFNLKTNRYQNEPIIFVNDKSEKIVLDFINSEIEKAYKIGYEEALDKLPINPKGK